MLMLSLSCLIHCERLSCPSVPFTLPLLVSCPAHVRGRPEPIYGETHAGLIQTGMGFLHKLVHVASQCTSNRRLSEPGGRTSSLRPMGSGGRTSNRRHGGSTSNKPIRQRKVFFCDLIENWFRSYKFGPQNNGMANVHVCTCVCFSGFAPPTGLPSGKEWQWLVLARTTS